MIKRELDILGIRIDNLEKKEILEKIEGVLNDGKFHQIATINPEFILAAQKDKEFKNILNGCDLNVADGTGVKFAFWRYGKKLKCRMAGVDLMWKILRAANNRGLNIFLVVNRDGLSSWEETAEAINKIYPKLNTGGINISPNHIRRGNYELGIRNYDIVFCNFGAPRQEKFIHSLKTGDYGKIKLAMGVGGSFDFLAGKLRRAPLWMRKIGLEWLFRLMQQPKRVKRIFNAVIVFPIKIIINRYYAL